MTDIAKLRWLLAAATPGPWEPWQDHPHGHICSMPILRSDEGNQANRALILKAINALPALLDELDRLRAERD